MRSNDNQAFVNRNESLSDPFLGNRENSRQSSSRLDRTSTLSNNYLVRRLTSVYENLPNRDEVINEMIKVSNAKGPDGDVPLPGGFASELRFWKLALISVILGCLMGLLGCFYLNLTDQVPKYWTNNDEFSNPDDLQPYSGQMFWVGVTAGAGLIVGLCRWLSSFPDSNDGLFKEINNYHVDHKFSIQTYFLSIISLSGGAALGPEAALSNAGGGLGMLIIDYVELDDADQKLVVLSGMAAAIGALFPTPILAVMVILELGKPPRSLMECVMLLSISSTTAFLVNYSLIGKTWLEYVNPQLVAISLAWDFSLWDCLDAAAIGGVCAVIAFVFLLAAGVSKQVFNRIKIRFESIPFLAHILPPVLGGLMIGFTNYGLPSTVGNGSMLISTLVKDAYTGDISRNLLIQTCFARGCLLAISMNCGFLGGFIFPLITIGILVGCIAHDLLPDASFSLFLACFMSALPAGIAPIPYTFICLTAFLFSLNVYQITPVFIATMVSYLIVSGTGILPTLQRKAQEREQASLQARTQDKLRRLQQEDENANDGRDVEEKGGDDPLSLFKYIRMNKEKAAGKSTRSLSPS